MLGLIFLKFADNNYRRHEAEIVAEYQKRKGTRREKKISDIAIEKCRFYLPDHARYDHLLNLPEEKEHREGTQGGDEGDRRVLYAAVCCPPNLMVEMIEPHGGKVFDPACGSGGMFVPLMVQL